MQNVGGIVMMVLKRKGKIYYIFGVCFLAELLIVHIYPVYSIKQFKKSCTVCPVSISNSAIEPIRILHYKNQPIRIQESIKFYLGKITPEPALGVVVVLVARSIGIAYCLINKKEEFK